MGLNWGESWEDRVEEGIQEGIKNTFKKSYGNLSNTVEASICVYVFLGLCVLNICMLKIWSYPIAG